MNSLSYPSRLLILLAAVAGLSPASIITASFDGPPANLEIGGNGVLAIEGGALFGVVDAGANERIVTIAVPEAAIYAFKMDITNLPLGAGSGINVWGDGQLLASIPGFDVFDGVLRYEGTTPFTELQLRTNSPSPGALREHFLLRGIMVFTMAPEIDVEPELFIETFSEFPDDELPTSFGPEQRVVSNPEPGTWVMAAAGLGLVGISRIRRRN